MTTDIIIRPTEVEDLPFIRDVLNNVIVDTDNYLSEKLKSEGDILNWFKEHQNNKRYRILTALSGNDFAGWVSLSPFRKADGYDSTAELSVYVHPSHYRKGIASKLIWEIESVALDTGLIHCLISVITSDNVASIALHEKHGFTVSGVLREIAYKNGQSKDVLLMTKILN